MNRLLTKEEKIDFKKWRESIACYDNTYGLELSYNDYLKAKEAKEAQLAIQKSKDPFVTEKDIIELAKHDIQYDIDIPIFLDEIRSFFNAEWHEEHYIHHKLNTLDELNAILLDYPSTGGYHILEDSFTSPSKENFTILSNKTKELLGYFYGICLR